LFSFIMPGERINFRNMSEDKIPSLYSVHRAMIVSTNSSVCCCH
jgi:hypothetical protein